MIFEYEGQLYPDYIRRGNASSFILPAALQFCTGNGLDVGGGKWPLPGARCLDMQDGWDALELPEGQFDYIFSSHCLEHVINPVAVLEHWRSRIKPGGVLFLYLPHKDMTYWRPTRNRKHLHSWDPAEMAWIMREVGFEKVIHSERDMYWSFSAVGFVPQ